MRPVFAVVVATVVLAPVTLGGWGMEVHRRLTMHAIDALPPELKSFFAIQREFIAEHSVDPDLWRVVDLRTERGSEEPNHFLDIDGLDEPRPFTNVPREWTKYVARYGLDRANKMGRLPWHTDDIYQKLVAMFGAIAKGTPPYAPDNARYLAAVLAHYIEDAHQPFHAVVNYDGQLTGQRGIHARFETELPLRNWESVKLAPAAVRPIDNMRDFIFETLVTSESLVSQVLDADRRATAGREFYDDGYFAAMFKELRPMLERRLSESASAVVSAIVSAWSAAGRPVLPVNRPATPQPIRR